MRSSLDIRAESGESVSSENSGFVGDTGGQIILTEQLNAKVELCLSTDVRRQGTRHRPLQGTAL